MSTPSIPSTPTAATDRSILLEDARLELVVVTPAGPHHARWTPSETARSYAPRAHAIWPTLCGTESQGARGDAARTVQQRTLCKSCLRVLRTQGPGVARYADEPAAQPTGGVQ